MRPVLGLIVALGLLVTSTVAPAQSINGLSPQLSYTIPGISNHIGHIKFADVNGDGLKEVLAANNSNVVLYDIVNDLLLFSIEVDTGTAITGVALKDVNRDSVVDIVISEWSSSFYPDTMNCLVSLYDGASNWQSHDSVAFSSDHGLWGAAVGPKINAVDLDFDGFDELIVSYDSIHYESFFGEDTWGITRRYRTFPGIEEQPYTEQLTAFYALPEIAGLPRFLATEHDYEYLEVGPDTRTEYYTLQGVDSTAVVAPQLWGPGGSYCYLDNNRHDHTAQFRCAVPTDTSMIVILRSSYYHWCEGSYPDTVITSSGSNLSAYEITSDRGTQLKWTYTGAQVNYFGFLYRESDPNHVYCFKSDTLVRADVEDCSIVRRFGTVPGPTRIWEKPYTNDEDYLVSIDSTTVTYFAFDVLTDVDEQSGPGLPASFTLGNPYPNPFNPEVTIPVSMATRGDVSIVVYNTLGQRVDIVRTGSLAAGEHSIQWNGESHPSGVYFFEATAGAESQTVKAVLLK